MRLVNNRLAISKQNRDTGSFALLDLRANGAKERDDLTPPNIRSRG
jgi:hypothetical protein